MSSRRLRDPQWYIYGNHGVGWTCLDLETGEQQWNERVGNGSLCFADDMLYLFSAASYLKRKAIPGQRATWNWVPGRR